MHKGHRIITMDSFLELQRGPSTSILAGEVEIDQSMPILHGCLNTISTRLSASLHRNPKRTFGTTYLVF